MIVYWIYKGTVVVMIVIKGLSGHDRMVIGFIKGLSWS